MHLPTERIGLSLFNQCSSQHAANPIALWFLCYTIRSLVMVLEGIVSIYGVDVSFHVGYIKLPHIMLIVL